MDFLVHWWHYLASFAAGSAVAWAIVALLIKPGSDEATTATPASYEVGAAQ
ncbi:hypothetical protein [Mycobacterium sp.]|uniref:channel accessory protein ArfB n=1 Tax=Mycobacterium sp. TaxID=1785 RepID=UPI003BAA3BBC